MQIAFSYCWCIKTKNTVKLLKSFKLPFVGLLDYYIIKFNQIYGTLLIKLLNVNI